MITAGAPNGGPPAHGWSEWCGGVDPIARAGKRVNTAEIHDGTWEVLTSTAARMWGHRPYGWMLWKSVKAAER